jgi:hypothetical protein
MQSSEQIKVLLDRHYAGATSNKMPFIFNGVDGPRFLGYVHNYEDAGMLMLGQRLSAVKLSIATITGDERRFIVAH